MKLIEREYLYKLINVIGTPDIKVITGVRRSGKSKLLDMFEKYVEKNIENCNIISINFNLLKYENLKEYQALNEYIESKYMEDKTNFVIIDEVQMCDGFEKTINSLHATEKYDIYICSAFVMDGYEHLSGKFIMDKYNFLVKKFPFLDAKKFIFTGAKNLFEADVQLDDRLSNMKGNVKQKFVFLSYHNRNIPKEELEKYNVVPVNGWKEVLEILGE